jgi:Flp pilus assembly protein CpaB
VSRRARAIAFGIVALACAGLAAAMASGYRSDVAAQLGPLRPVLVAARTLAANHPLTPDIARRSLAVRRVPARFVPPGAVATPRQAIGQVPTAAIPVGAYVLSAQLRPPGSRRRAHRASPVGPGREPVEIAVSGAGPLATGTGGGIGGGVDVIVTTEPQGASAVGRTYVAAAGVPLLDLRQGGDGDSAGLATASSGTWTATLALTRPEALKLIEAESFARQIRLIAAAR